MHLFLSRRARARHHRRRLGPLIDDQLVHIDNVNNERSAHARRVLRADNNLTLRDDEDYLYEDDGGKFPLRSAILACRERRSADCNKLYQQELDQNILQLNELLELDCTLAQEAGQKDEPLEQRKSLCCFLCTRSALSTPTPDSTSPLLSSLKAAEKTLNDLERDIVGAEDELHRLEDCIDKARDADDEPTLKDHQRCHHSVQRKLRRYQELIKPASNKLNKFQEEHFRCRMKQSRDKFHDMLKVFTSMKSNPIPTP